MYNTASKLHNSFVRMYFDIYNLLPDVKWNKIVHKYDPKKLFLETYNYNVWSENDKPFDTTKIAENSTYLSLLPLLEDHEEVEEVKRKTIKNINSKLLTRLPILLAQIKAGILYLLYQHNKITKKVYSNLIKSL